MKMRNEDINKLVEILANLAANSGVDPKDYFRNMVNKADLPPRWKRERAGSWKGDADMDARDLINWSLTRRVNPQDERFTTLGSILKPFVDEYLTGDNTSKLPIDEEDNSHPYPLIRLIIKDNLYFDTSEVSKLENLLGSNHQIDPDIDEELGHKEETQPINRKTAKSSSRLKIFSILFLISAGSITISYLLLLFVPKPPPHTEDNLLKTCYVPLSIFIKRCFSLLINSLKGEDNLLKTCYVPSSIFIELCRSLLINSLTILYLLGDLFYEEFLELIGRRNSGNHVCFFRIFLGIVAIFFGVFTLIYHVQFGPDIFNDSYPCQEPKFICMEWYKTSYKVYIVQSLINYIFIGVLTFIIIIYSQIKDINDINKKKKEYEQSIKDYEVKISKQKMSDASKKTLLNIFGNFHDYLFRVIKRYEPAFFVYCILFGFEMAVGLIPLTETAKIVSVFVYFLAGFIFTIIVLTAMKFHDDAIQTIQNAKVPKIYKNEISSFLHEKGFMKSILEVIKTSSFIQLGIFIAGLGLFSLLLSSNTGINIITLIFVQCKKN